MSQSSIHFERERIYCLKNGQLTPTQPAQNQQSLCSVFSDQDLSEQIDAFLKMAQDWPVDVHFRLKQNDINGCWEIFANHRVLHQLVNHSIAQSPFDYLLWPENTFKPPQLLLFDMDSTFIEIEVIDELARRHHVGEQVASVTEAAMRGELDFAESLVSRVACLKGLSESVIDEIAQSLPISTGVESLVKAASRNECKVAIVSGGFMPFVEKLKNDLGLYRVHANRLKVVAGELVGEVEGKIVDAQAKADFLLALCQSLNIQPEQAMAIGDGANDLLMMQQAGFNLAYKAKPKVQAEARGRINSTHLGRLSQIFSW